MRRNALFLILPLFLIYRTVCPQISAFQTADSPKPFIKIHYLGHSSFIFSFDNGKTMLIDYGESNAYGLDSPIYGIGSFKPDIVAYTHHDADHDRGLAFNNAELVDRRQYSKYGIEIMPVPVTERVKNDNCGYLIRYKGLIILHAGDCQGLMTNGADTASIRALTESLSGSPDMVMIPVGWVRNIVPEAAAFAGLFKETRIIPMHYWSKEEKKDFLSLIAAKEEFKIIPIKNPFYILRKDKPEKGTIIISLEPGKYEKKKE